MSDLADLADHLIHAEIAAGRVKIQQAVTLPSTGYCFYCGEHVTQPHRFCDVHCRDGYEVELAARRRAGLGS